MEADKGKMNVSTEMIVKILKSLFSVLRKTEPYQHC